MTTRFEHAEEIKVVLRLRNFADAEPELTAWVDARAWTTGDGPKAIFNDAVVWLLERGVLLPGVTTLARLVAQVRDEATLRRDEAYRRDIKGIRNLQEGRHSRAAAIFHGKEGELYQRYRKGMEDQLGALGLVLNCGVLWNTFYMNAALEQLRDQGQAVLDEDVARLSPFVRHHLNVHGKYSFLLPELLGGLRALGDPNAADPGED